MRYGVTGAVLAGVASLTVGAAGCAARRVPPETIIAIERQALDRWGRGDPQGFLESYAADVTYFDPFQPRRVDGRETMIALYAPLAGQVRIPRYEMLNPLVQQQGDMAVLSYNLVSHTTDSLGAPRAVRWNSSTVYRRTAGAWKMIHSHWSFTAAGAP